jgi:putative FmdB family regulatory protein
MPTYEYACKGCGHRFDVWQSMSDDALTICPECGGELRKVFAPPAISFKGSGFYATDHGKKAKPSESDGATKDGAKKDGAGKDGAGKEAASSGGSGASGSSAPIGADASPATGKGAPSAKKES